MAIKTSRLDRARSPISGEPRKSLCLVCLLFHWFDLAFLIIAYNSISGVICVSHFLNLKPLSLGYWGLNPSARSMSVSWKYHFYLITQCSFFSNLVGETRGCFSWRLQF